MKGSDVAKGSGATSHDSRAAPRRRSPWREPGHGRHRGLQVPGAGSGARRETGCAIIDSSVRAGARSSPPRSLLALIRPFVSICLLRLRPQDLPASNVLLALAMLAYVATTTIAHSALLSPADALLSSIADSVLLCTLTLSLLYVCRRRRRAVQTLTALVGTGAVTTMAAIPFLSWRVSLLRAGDPAGVEMVGLVVVVAWNLVVIAHVLRHALSISYLGGGVVAVVMYLLSSQILGALVAGRISL